MINYLSLLAWNCSLDSISTLDHVRLEADRTRGAMQLEEEATGVTKNRADLIATPEGGSGGGTVLTDRLL